MKTAKEYLYAVMGCEPVNSRMDYTDALEAVQAALNDAATIREQVRQGIVDCFGGIMPFELPPESPAATPPIQMGQPLAQPNVFPPACPRCLQRGAECLCWLPSARLVPTNPNEEQPPF